MRRVTLYTDGAARGNPGPAAIGVVIADSNGSEIEAFGEAIGVATNNEAEYRALLRGLERAAKLGADGVDVLCDSELMVQQLSSVYRVRAVNLKPLYTKARRALSRFASAAIRHIPRARNRRADALANAALDAAGQPNPRDHSDGGLF